MDPLPPRSDGAPPPGSPLPSGPADEPLLLAPRPWPRRDQADSPLRGRRVLVVAGDLERARALAQGLARRGLASQATAGGEPLAGHLEQGRWEAAVVAPTELSHGELELLGSALGERPLVLLGSAPPEAGAQALVRAAHAVLGEQADAEALHTALGRAFEHRLLRAENERLRARLDDRLGIGGIVTRDPAMQRILRTLEAVADTHASVLLCGESGTGKTMLARTLHQLGSRREGPFVVVNCGALPDALLESELFGHARGAFTGAVRDRPGRFEEAHGGTIFLDEINSASLDLQVKLLRVLQERAFERVGDSRTRTVDVRVVTASNADLREEIAAGRFREDLYYRIHVVALELPPLRERPRDVLLLAERFVERFATEYRRPVQGLDAACRAALVGYPWPGNVRELENTLERAVLLAEGEVLAVTDLGPELLSHLERRNPHGLAGFELEGAGLNLGLGNLERLPPLRKALEGPERAILVRALELCEGNRTRAAEMLEINRTTLFHKMRKYGLMERSFSSRPEVP